MLLSFHVRQGKHGFCGVELFQDSWFFPREPIWALTKSSRP
jgi:hypothetical protein